MNIFRMSLHYFKTIQVQRSCSSSNFVFQIPSVAWFSHSQAWYLFNMWSAGVTFDVKNKITDLALIVIIKQQQTQSTECEIVGITLTCLHSPTQKIL